MDFETIWQKHEQNKSRQVKTKKKVRTIALLFTVSLLSLSIGVFATQSFFIKDNIEYAFVEDPSLVGEWVAVGLVKDPLEYTVDLDIPLPEGVLSQLAFLSNGKVLMGTKDNPDNPYHYSSFTFTKGHILSINDATDSLYEIRSIENTAYLFMQFKSGAYSKGLVTNPPYLVLKQVSQQDLKDYKPKNLRNDNTDLPFENDPNLIGLWQSVDYVSDPESFNPNGQQYVGDLYLVGLKVIENGDSKAKFENSESPFESYLTWTNGYFINESYGVVEAYETKTIDGKTYLFLPWISGDVVYGGKSPSYYVLEKK